MKKFLLMLFVMMGLCVNILYAQKSNSIPKVMIASRPQQQSILLRWAATTPSAWKISNEYGFIVERYTVIRDKKILENPDKKLLNPTPIKPSPLNDWEAIAKQNNYAAIIAQAIYGKDFELDGGDDKGVAKIINKSSELEQRFTMGLYAADNNFEAAKLAGWAWEDKEVKPNEKYLYRIISAVPKEKMKIDSSSTFIGLADYQPLPKPSDISSIFGDKTVMLSWDYNMLRNYYNSYFIEKSSDGGKNFVALSDLPVTNFNEKDNKPSDRIYFIDSLRDNGTDFQYRIKGISPFGEVGPASDPIVGKGKKILAFVPGITSTYVNEKGSLKLEWEFDKSGRDLVKSFTLNQSETENGVYKAVVENIPAFQRSIEFEKLYATNYFTITAVGKDGESQTSFPVLIQTLDSIPPSIPTAIVGTIDTNGVVKLSWEKNKEKDFLGYKIFRSNNLKEEMAVLSDSVIIENKFFDTVSIKTLNNKLYYAVAALDNRYNQSVASTVIEISKPDIIPPSSPVFSNYNIQNGVVYLSWTNSTDEDVELHYLYRKTENEDWGLIKNFTDTAHTYLDNEVTSGVNYQYKIIAKDKSGLASLATTILNVTIPIDPKELVIKNINSYIDRNKRYIEISWKDNLKEVEEYQLYKSVKGQPLTLWKIAKPEEGRSTIDQDIAVNTEYEYGIKAVLKNGAFGKYKSVTVKY